MTLATMIASPPAPDPHSWGQPHLLVIEDDPVTLTLMRRLFTGEYHVSTAPNGYAGLNILAQGGVDIVLLDVMMPGMNGFAVLKEIRSTPETSDLPVILVSGLTDNEHIVEGLQLGANDYLLKPVNVHVARARLQTQLKLKELLDEQKRAISRMEELSRLREHFFRIASHDLKNPLSNLHLAIQELNLFVPHNTETAGIQQAIDVTLGQMRSLIEDFLDVAALQSTSLGSVNSPTPVRDCLQAVVNQYERAAARKQITLVIDEAEGAIITDYSKLLQVIGNLVSNAIKYSPEGTTVTLWSRRSDDHLRIFVQDEGPGISADDQTRLFEEFFKGSTQPTGGETSTGLGLWIVSKLVALLNGSVGFDSTLEHGSVFWIELPMPQTDAR